MIHSKRVIFMILPLLFVPLVYGISPTPEAYALPRDPNYHTGSCGAETTNPNTGDTQITCCWEGRDPGKLPPLNKVTYCQTCNPATADCGPRTAHFTATPDRVPPGVLENLPTLEQVPTTPTLPPLEQVPTTPTPPPLFGRNIPLQTIVPQYPVVTPEPPVPMFGSTQQQATPTPPPTGGGGLTGVAPSTGEAAPLTDRGPTSCPVGNVWDPNLMICVPDLPPPPQLCPDGSIPQSTGPGGIRPECPSFKAEQPEVEEQEEEPQDEGQEEPDEGQDTATGPLT
jgi:hypothetical protein